MESITLEEIKKEIESDGIKLKRSDDEFKAAVILLTSAGTDARTDVTKLKKFTKYPLKFIEEISERLIANRIWIGDKIYCNWFDAKTGGEEFWSDVGVALGHLKRGYTKKEK